MKITKKLKTLLLGSFFAIFMLGCEADLSIYNGTGNDITGLYIVSEGSSVSGAVDQLNADLLHTETISIVGITDCGYPIDVYFNEFDGTNTIQYLISGLDFPCGVSAELDIYNPSYSYGY